jgi:hypothetical protein
MVRAFEAEGVAFSDGAVALPLWTHDLHTYGGFIPLSPQLLAEIKSIRAAEMNARIGPVHGPPLPRHLATRRALGGHPAGSYVGAPT